jgi:mRNA interferase YafQ
MRTIHQTSQFRRDLKKLKKQRKDLEKLKEVVLVLLSGRPLESRYRDHALIGPWQGSRDCHIEPDWLPIYRLESDSLFLERTGSHSELFKK